MRRFVLWIFAGLMLAAPSSAGPVGDAAKKGDTAKVERLLASGADANEKGPMASPLHWAAMNGHVAVIKVLADSGAELNAQSSMLGAPLHAASRFDRTDAIKALLAAGANPDVRDRDEFTPLMRAVIENRPAAVEALLDAGADVNAVGYAPGGGMDIGTGPTIALQLSIRFGRDEITPILLSAGAGPIPPRVPSDLASLGDAKQGRELVYSNCTVCHQIEKADPEMFESIHEGPHLIGVMGRPVAGVSGYKKYSKELIAHGGSWTLERFYQYVHSPTRTVPGTRMVHADNGTAEMVADMTAYFRLAAN